MFVSFIHFLCVRINSRCVYKLNVRVRTFRRVTQVEASEKTALSCVCVGSFCVLCYYLKGKETLGQSPREITFPFCFFFSLSLLFFLFCSPSLCRPSSALLISLRYGSQWRLISLLCNNQSCCFFLMLSQPRPLILLVYQLAVYDACGTSRCGGWGGWRTPSTLPTCARR